MQTSNVLVVGPTHPNGKDFGADFVHSFTEARKYLGRHHPAVLVFGPTQTPQGPAEFESFCQYAAKNSPQSLWIVATTSLPPAALVYWCNSGQLHGLIDDFDDPELESQVQAGLEASGEAAQRQKLVELFEEQSLRLHRLSLELEARVQKRHKQLRKTLRTLDETKSRMGAFHKALLGIHRASTVLQMEQTLNEAMKDVIDLDWVRVRFEAQSLLKRQATGHILAIELPYQFDKIRGEVLFAKVEGKKFTADEKDFLLELSEALALSVSRLQKLEQAETLKAQWQATFDSIPHPLCLVSSKNEILKLNRAFVDGAAATFHNLIGKGCFTSFFGADFNPPQNLESPYAFRNSRTSVNDIQLNEIQQFEVRGQRLGLTYENQNVQLVILREVTEEARFERRILDASKLAELGTIGSSIAHELNNPLGGMLSFLQLILMDLKKDDPLTEEIHAMEEAVLRCRDIVLNLLSFARKQDLGEFTRVDLWEVLEKAVKLNELQSKSQGIAIEFKRPDQEPALVKASPNALSQALCNLLQNSIDAIAVRLKSEPLFSGKIQIELERDNRTSGDKFRLKVTDNGTGIRAEVQSQIFNPLFTTRDPKQHGGMGLTTAFTIVAEHHGTLEILSQTGSGTTAILTLPRLVL